MNVIIKFKLDMYVFFFSQPKLLPELTFQGENKENSTKSNGDDCIVISDDENGDKKSVETNLKEEVTDVKKDIEVNGRDTPPILKSEASLSEKQKQIAKKATWAFIDTPEHLDALIACLNTRGFRECALRTTLMELKPLLQQSLRDCPTDMLSLPEDGGEEKARIQVCHILFFFLNLDNRLHGQYLYFFLHQSRTKFESATC